MSGRQYMYYESSPAILSAHICLESFNPSMGTIGGGNHFAELQVTCLIFDGVTYFSSKFNQKNYTWRTDLYLVFLMHSCPSANRVCVGPRNICGTWSLLFGIILVGSFRIEGLGSGNPGSAHGATWHRGVCHTAYQMLMF